MKRSLAFYTLEAAITLDLIIINFNCSDLSIECLKSARDVAQSVTLIPCIVDNGSTDDSLERFSKELPDCKVLPLGTNRGYAAAVNEGLKNTSSEFVLLCNADLIFDRKRPTFCHDLLRALEADPVIAVVGVQQLFADGRWQRSFGLVPGVLSALSDLLGLTFLNRVLRTRLHAMKLQATTPRTVPYLDGAFLCARREALEQIKGMDESFFFFGEDVDLCIRLRDKGFKVMFMPGFTIVHLRGASRRADLERERATMHMNEAARIRIHRRRSTAFMVRLATAFEALYYTEMWLAHAVRAILSSKENRTSHQHKADLCKHGALICAEELEKIE